MHGAEAVSCCYRSPSSDSVPLRPWRLATCGGRPAAPAAGGGGREAGPSAETRWGAEIMEVFSREFLGFRGVLYMVFFTVQVFGMVVWLQLEDF